MTQDVQPVSALHKNPFECAIAIEGSTQIHCLAIDLGGNDIVIDATAGSHFADPYAPANLHGFAVGEFDLNTFHSGRLVKNGRHGQD